MLKNLDILHFRKSNTILVVLVCFLLDGRVKFSNRVAFTILGEVRDGKAECNAEMGGTEQIETDE